VVLQCFKVSAISQEELLSLIPAETLAKIKQTDEHPFFQAYSIAHEGISSPRIVGEGTKKISWPKKAIQSLKNIISRGVKFFRGHKETNSTEGRQEIGEIVADTQKEIDGKLHHIVISYHSPAVREIAKEFDVVSQEAEWNLIEDAGNLIADTIHQLTGIAMGDSRKEKPAFAGAVRLGMIQAFESDQSGGEPDKNKTGENIMPTLKEIKTYVQEMDLWPSQLFDPERIKADNNFAKFFEEAEKLKTNLTAKETELEVLKKGVAEAEKKVLAANAKSRLEEMLKSNILKLTDRQREYIKANFDENTNDVTDDAIRQYMEKAAGDYQKNAKFFGGTENIGDGGAAEPPKGDDMTKAANNPLLEEDL